LFHFLSIVVHPIAMMKVSLGLGIVGAMASRTAPSLNQLLVVLGVAAKSGCHAMPWFTMHTVKLMSSQPMMKQTES
jgi:hypothetical protein